MIEIIVYLKKDYSKNKSIWVNGNLSKKEILKIINSYFKVWYFYDIKNK